MTTITPPILQEEHAWQGGQVSLSGFPYLPAVSLRLIEAIAFAARDARKDAGLKQSRIAAALDADQSTIARFEKGNWPENLEATIRAYSEELEMKPEELLTRGIKRWATNSNNGRR